MSTSHITPPVRSSALMRPSDGLAGGLAVGLGAAILKEMQSADVYAPLAMALCGLGVGLLTACVAAARRPREERVGPALRAGLAGGLGMLVAGALSWVYKPW